MAKLFTFLLIIINISLAVSGQLAIKAGMKQVGYMSLQSVFPLMIAAFKNIYVLLGLFAYTLAAGTWIIVLSRVDVSFAYPMLSLGYVAIIILSAAILGETISVMRIFGTGFVVVGILLIFNS